MERVFVKFALIGLSFLFLFSTANTQVKKNDAKIVEPTAKEAIKQILLNGDIRLAEAQHCQNMGTDFSDKTILDFLSGVLAFQTEPDTTNKIEFTFKQEKGKLNELLWICDVLFRSGDDETPSSNGIRFKMHNADRKLMRQSLICIGTG